MGNIIKCCRKNKVQKSVLQPPERLKEEDYETLYKKYFKDIDSEDDVLYQPRFNLSTISTPQRRPQRRRQ